jgi:hypothetical protein
LLCTYSRLSGSCYCSDDTSFILLSLLLLFSSYSCCHLVTSSCLHVCTCTAVNWFCNLLRRPALISFPGSLPHSDLLKVVIVLCCLLYCLFCVRWINNLLTYLLSQFVNLVWLFYAIRSISIMSRFYSSCHCFSLYIFCYFIIYWFKHITLVLAFFLYDKFV